MIRISVIDTHVIELPDRQIIAFPPTVAAILGIPDAAIVARDDIVGIRGIDPNIVDAETAADTFKLNSDERDRLRRLFEQSDEWQYSGAHNGPGRISPENRREVLELIENLK